MFLFLHCKFLFKFSFIKKSPSAPHLFVCLWVPINTLMITIVTTVSKSHWFSNLQLEHKLGEMKFSDPSYVICKYSLCIIAGLGAFALIWLDCFVSSSQSREHTNEFERDFTHCSPITMLYFHHYVIYSLIQCQIYYERRRKLVNVKSWCKSKCLGRICCGCSAPIKER